MLQVWALAAGLALAPPESCEDRIEAAIASELETINAGMALYASTPPAEWSADERALMNTTMQLLDARDRPVSATDVAILDGALALLSEEAVWDRADDRQCDPSDRQWSIFCALHAASRAETGVYAHRRTALQEVRFIIQGRSEGRDYAHRMMDYNNDPTTGFEDARSVIAEARAVVATRLASQCPAP